MKVLAHKATDLEDRSRRDNIVVFGIPEAAPNNKPENTEMLLTQVLKSHAMINSAQDMDHDPVFQQVHRLGPKEPNSGRPRPIIAKCVYFKDRQFFVQNSGRLKGTGINISEDFSKPTLYIQ